MKQGTRRPDYYQALGETIAADAELRALKDETRHRLEAGKSEDSIVACLSKETRRVTTRRERMAADRWLTLWILDWAKTGNPGPPIPSGAVVFSCCGERTCIEPAHLALGAPGRYPTGRAVPATEQDSRGEEKG